MDSITQIAQKMLAERARQAAHQQPTPPETAPPPYSASDSDDDSDNEGEADMPSSPVKLTINAAHSIRGSNNLVPTSPSALQDATKFGSILLQAVDQINNTAHQPGRKPYRSVNIDLTINCGITVIGDRNVIGNVALKPKPPQTAMDSAGAVLQTSTVAGAKRKAEDASCSFLPFR